jgi:hypothetical protein
MAMQMMKAAGVAVLALAVAGTAYAQTRFTDAEIVGAIGKCLSENAPADWRTVIFKLDPAPAVAGKKASAIVEHKVFAGADGSEPQDLKPCRPDYAPKAVQTLRESQDEKARGWTGITVTVNRDGRYSINYRYPK